MLADISDADYTAGGAGDDDDHNEKKDGVNGEQRCFDDGSSIYNCGGEDENDGCAAKNDKAIMMMTVERG